MRKGYGTGLGLFIIARKWKPLIALAPFPSDILSAISLRFFNL